MKACLPSNQCTVPENTKLLQDNIYVCIVILFDYVFYIVIFLKKSLAGGHTFGCIKSMLNFTEVESDPHKEQC